MNKENTYLIELHGEPQRHICNLENGTTMPFNGFRIFAIYNCDSEEVARYSHTTDSIDISPICKEGVQLAWVSSVDGGHTLSWLTAVVESFSPDMKEIVIKENRLANEEEINFLNETFPQWYSHSACTEEEFLAKNGERNENK